MKRYKCVKDYQTGEWCVGTIKTAEGWRRLALTWADSDENKWATKNLKALHGKSDEQIIEFISDYWEIKIIEEEGEE